MYELPNYWNDSCLKRVIIGWIIIHIHWLGIDIGWHNWLNPRPMGRTASIMALKRMKRNMHNAELQQGQWRTYISDHETEPHWKEDSDDECTVFYLWTQSNGQKKGTTKTTRYIIDSYLIGFTAFRLSVSPLLRPFGFLSHHFNGVSAFCCSGF